MVSSSVIPSDRAPNTNVLELFLGNRVVWQLVGSHWQAVVDVIVLGVGGSMWSAPALHTSLGSAWQNGFDL